VVNKNVLFYKVFATSAPYPQYFYYKGILKSINCDSRNIRFKCRTFWRSYLLHEKENINISRTCNRLKPDDLPKMSVLSFIKNWYDNNLKYVLECLDTLRHFKIDQVIFLPQSFDSIVLDINEKYTNYHNDMFWKRIITLGPVGSYFLILRKKVVQNSSARIVVFNS